MSNNKSNIIKIFLVIAFLGLFILMNIIDFSDPCFEANKFRSEEFEGYVLKLFEDERNHLYKTVEIEQVNSAEIKTIILFRDQGCIYESLSLGDFIVKKKGEFSLLINNIEYNPSFSDQCKSF
jgi:hypothetical protein